MDHVALMKRSWHLTEKVLSGEKTIESRWYTTRRTPWGNIAVGDSVYFKDSGCPVTVKATVDRVMQMEVTPKEVKEILDEYGVRIGIPKESKDKFHERFKDKRYCILIFVKDVKAAVRGPD